MPTFYVKKNQDGTISISEIPIDGFTMVEAFKIDDIYLDDEGNIVVKDIQASQQEFLQNQEMGNFLKNKTKIFEKLKFLENKVLSFFPESQKLAFQIRLQEANDILSNNTIDPEQHKILYSYFVQRYGGIPSDFQVVIDYCNSIITLESVLKNLSGKVTALNDEIKEATTTEQLVELENKINALENEIISYGFF